MQTTYRLFVKRPASKVEKDPVTGVQSDIAESVDVDAKDIYKKMRELEKKYPGHRITSKMLNPLGL